MTVQFNILGPLQLYRDRQPVPVNGLRSQRILALLLVNAGRAVSDGAIVDLLWPGDPPRTALSQVHNCVCALRRLLYPQQRGAPLRRVAGGYVIQVRTDQVDSARFEDLLADAGRYSRKGDRNAAVAALRSADGLWRGPALCGISQGYLETEATRLHELRVTAAEARLGLRVELGEHAGAVPELFALASAHPLRDRPQGELAIALYRTGRAADALNVLDRVRRARLEEYGLNLSGHLQALRQDILVEAPVLGRLRSYSAWCRE